MKEQIDRTEFKKRLDSLFDWKTSINLSEVLGALLDNDTQKINEFKTKKSTKKQKIDTYLAQWDAAETQEAKDAVVGSVTTLD